MALEPSQQKPVDENSVPNARFHLVMGVGTVASVIKCFPKTDLWVKAGCIGVLITTK